MADSPIGRIEFTALNRDWCLKFGTRARFRVEQVFNTGFAAAVIDCFPDITPDVIAKDSPEALAGAMTNLARIKIGSLAVLFECGLTERVDEDTLDAITEELGTGRMVDLLAAAFSGSAPTKAKDAAADAAPGEAKPKRRKR